MPLDLFPHIVGQAIGELVEVLIDEAITLPLDLTLSRTPLALRSAGDGTVQRLEYCPRCFLYAHTLAEEGAGRLERPLIDVTRRGAGEELVDVYGRPRILIGLVLSGLAAAAISGRPSEFAAEHLGQDLEELAHGRLVNLDKLDTLDVPYRLAVVGVWLARGRMHAVDDKLLPIAEDLNFMVLAARVHEPRSHFRERRLGAKDHRALGQVAKADRDDAVAAVEKFLGPLLDRRGCVGIRYVGVENREVRRLEAGV